MAGKQREEMIAVGSVEVARATLSAYEESLRNAAVFLACDSRIAEQSDTGKLLRQTRERLLALRAVLTTAGRAFDEEMEGLVR
jgi:hypothetical protein